MPSPVAWATPFIGSNQSRIVFAASGCSAPKISALIFGYHCSTRALLFPANAAHSGALEVSISTVKLSAAGARGVSARSASTSQPRSGSALTLRLFPRLDADDLGKAIAVLSRDLDLLPDLVAHERLGDGG